ncbi:Basement membrane-specific heparan sulfate proteoglycan core protein, partial [Acropora cervicornis]
GNQLTWNEPLPVLTVQESDSHQEVHRNYTRLIEDTINASLSWHFSLSSGLTLIGVNLKLKTVTIAFVSNQKPEVSAFYKDKYAINGIPNQRITLVIFNVTTEQNATFACEVVASGNGVSTWRSEVQVEVVADGKPRPKITWTRVSDNTAVTMPLAIIRGKNKESYRCTANNGVGKPLSKDVNINILCEETSTQVIVLIKQEEQLQVTLAKKFFVGRGETASLICQVEGNPKPTISWSSCDLPNVPCDKRYWNVSNVRTARANFNCTATNALGVDSASTVVCKWTLFCAWTVQCPRKVFANIQSYSGAELIVARCGSLIFDVVLKFSIKVAEDDTISRIQNSIVDGQLGGLNVNTSYIIGIPPIFETRVSTKSVQTITTVPTRTTPKSDGLFQFLIDVL